MLLWDYFWTSNRTVRYQEHLMKLQSSAGNLWPIRQENLPESGPPGAGDLLWGVLGPRVWAADWTVCRGHLQGRLEVFTAPSSSHEGASRKTRKASGGGGPEKIQTRFGHLKYNLGTNSHNPFSLILVKNELGAFSESLGLPLSSPYPIMAIAGL